MIKRQILYFFLILVILLSAGCKKNDLPDTTGDLPPAPSMEITDPVRLYKDAEFYLSENKPSVALDAVNAALKNSGDKAYGAFLKGRVHLLKKEYDKSLSFFKEAEDKGYHKDEINLYRGRLYVDKNDLNKALKFFLQSEAQIGNDAERQRIVGSVLFMNTGKLYQKKGNDDKAIKYFNKAIKLDPTDYKSFFYAGLSYYKVSKYIDASKYLEKCISLKPRYFVAYKYLATVYYTKGQKDLSFYTVAKGYAMKQTFQHMQLAHTELSKIKNIYFSRDALELMIYTKMTIGLNDAASVLIENGMKRFPLESIFWVFKGKVFLQKHAQKKALAIADEAIRKFGNNFELSILKADAYKALNNKKEAIKHYEAALSFDPENYTYRYRLATLYRDAKNQNMEFLHQGIYFTLRKQYEQAKYAFDKIPQGFQRSYEANTWLGRIYMEQDSLNASLDYLSKAISQKRDYYLPYTFKTFVLFKLGKKREAIALLKGFIASYPQAPGIKEINKMYRNFVKFL
jgi:tetratricopeptide (TPR) repeat protein